MTFKKFHPTPLPYPKIFGVLTNTNSFFIHLLCIYALFLYICINQFIINFMNLLNNTTVIGRIGNDAVIIPPSKNKSNQILSFDLATENTYTDPSTGEQQTQTNWYNVVMFFPKKKPIKIHENLIKGKLITVCGIVSAQAYMDKKTNQPKAKLKLIVKPGEIKFL